jgi:hypothetical protein
MQLISKKIMDKQCLYLCLAMFIECIWLHDTSYENFEGYKIHFERATNKMNFFIIWLFFVFIKLKMWSPKCKSHVHEIIMQKTCQVIYGNKCTHFLNLWHFTKILMHSYVCMWKITITVSITLSWIMQFFSLKFVINRFFIW